MKAIILALAILQLSLSTPNPEVKIAEKPKEYKVITKQNLGNGIKRRLGLLDSIKKAWNTVKAVGGAVVNKAKEVGNEVIDKLQWRKQFEEFKGVFTKFWKGPIDIIKDFPRNWLKYMCDKLGFKCRAYKL